MWRTHPLVAYSEHPLHLGMLSTATIPTALLGGGEPVRP